MSEVKLLPLPELPRQVEGYNSDYWEAGQIEEYAADYARANVAHATAAKDAEIETLRAEVERLKALVRSVGYETLDRAEQAEARAERLAEALRELRNHTSVNSDQIALIDAALEQESNDA